MAVMRESSYRKEYLAILKTCSDFGFSDTDDVPLSAIVRSAFSTLKEVSPPPSADTDTATTIRLLRDENAKLWGWCREAWMKRTTPVDAIERYRLRAEALAPPEPPELARRLFDAFDTMVATLKAAPREGATAHTLMMPRESVSQAIYAFRDALKAALLPAPPRAEARDSLKTAEELRDEAHDLFSDAAGWRDAADHGAPFDPRILTNEARAAELIARAEAREARPADDEGADARHLP